MNPIGNGWNDADGQYDFNCYEGSMSATELSQVFQSDEDDDQDSIDIFSDEDDTDDDDDDDDDDRLDDDN